MTRGQIKDIFNRRGLAAARRVADATKTYDLIEYVKFLEREQVKKEITGVWVAVYDFLGIPHIAPTLGEARQRMLMANATY